jgi:3-hydroxymyristoyl/3-hydroxydecanoyl-(acyl carrier protein) dehydratase
MIPFPRDLAPRPGSAGAFAFHVEADHLAFEGHFPDQPILPGVAQIDWALRLGEKAFGPLGTFTGLEHLKFQAVITPAELVHLDLAWDAARRELSFAYAGSEGPKSSGHARFLP